MSASPADFDYMDAVEAALTDKVWQRVRRYAVGLCYQLDREGLAGDVEDMTHDAVNDTFVGVRRWSPDKCALHVHLQGIIRSRVSNKFRHSMVARYVYVGARRDADGYDPIEVEITDVSAPAGNPEQQLIQRDVVDQTVAAIQELARSGNDNQVMQMIEAWRDGVTEREEVAARLGISTKKVKNARQRLMRLADRLPEPLRKGRPRND